METISQFAHSVCEKKGRNKREVVQKPCLFVICCNCNMSSMHTAILLRDKIARQNRAVKSQV